MHEVSHTIGVYNLLQRASIAILLISILAFLAHSRLFCILAYQ